ncbi:MAG: hypothetical protein JWM11_6265 [Planctomycetaceae bacterium]|nr:hypothetical protein [Planctomycetaceae bacterium]
MTGLAALTPQNAATIAQITTDVTTQKQLLLNDLVTARQTAATAHQAVVTDTATRHQTQADAWSQQDASSQSDFEASVADAQAAKARSDAKRQEVIQQDAGDKSRTFGIPSSKPLDL